MSIDKKGYDCVPGSRFLICFYLLSVAFLISLCIYSFETNQADVIPVIVLFIVVIILFMVWAWTRTMCKVFIGDDSLVCKTPFCKDIVIEYEKCTVGMDYHIQNNEKVWWIYLCYGSKPKFKSKNPANRINSLKCQQGFIRIMYREEIYNTLVCVLPKKQRIGLETSRRFHS